MRLQERGKSGLSNCSKLAVGAIAFTGVCSAEAHARSLLITSFFGEWRVFPVSCTEHRHLPAVTFSFDGDEYVEYGKAKCALKSQDGKSLEIANLTKCLKSGFAPEFAGRYSLLMVEGEPVHGHMIVENIQGIKKQLLDCEAHRLN